MTNAVHPVQAGWTAHRQISESLPNKPVETGLPFVSENSVNIDIIPADQPGMTMKLKATASRRGRPDPQRLRYILFIPVDLT